MNLTIWSNFHALKRFSDMVFSRFCIQPRLLQQKTTLISLTQLRLIKRSNLGFTSLF